jgi:hypothetical protein
MGVRLGSCGASEGMFELVEVRVHDAYVVRAGGGFLVGESPPAAQAPSVQ